MEDLEIQVGLIRLNIYCQYKARGRATSFSNISYNPSPKWQVGFMPNVE